jgi:enoyl-CoA hydratase/carnithine racemase
MVYKCADPSANGVLIGSLIGKLFNIRKPIVSIVNGMAVLGKLFEP